jgi:hypothetical protein
VSGTLLWISETAKDAGFLAIFSHLPLSLSPCFSFVFLLQRILHKKPFIIHLLITHPFLSASSPIPVHVDHHIPVHPNNIHPILGFLHSKDGPTTSKFTIREVPYG